METGMIRVWGKVPPTSPSYDDRTTKAEVMHNARFLNLWMADTPFSLETLVGVPRLVYPNSYMSKIDDKSGYYYILLSFDSQ